jgi:peroxiredoxin Q/BCP
MKTLLIVFCMLNIFPFSLFASSKDKIQVGDKAPIASAPNQKGELINLEEVYKKGWVLIYFYPKADTPGCTDQACSLRDSYEELQEQGVIIYGVSTDSVESQTKFKEKYMLPFDLLADQKKEVVRAFQVPHLLGLTRRQAFLIQDGILVWSDESASTKEQAKDVLHALKAIKKVN